MIKAFFRRDTVPVNSEIETDFRVHINDLDLNMHMNNGRYLTIMDLGRFDFISKTGILKIAIKNKWFPILGASQITHLRPLAPFQKYKLYTKLECWDNKWIIMIQRFESNGKICAIGKVRGLLRGPSGNISPQEILDALGVGDTPSPEISKETVLWIKSLSLPNKY